MCARVPGQGRRPRRVAAAFDADNLSLRQAATLRGIIAYAQAAGWELVLAPFAFHDGPGRWDGILVPTHKWQARALKRAPAPVVCVAWSQRQLLLPAALENRYLAGRLAAQHLVERGYRAFAYVGFQRDTQSYIERKDFCLTLRRMGRDPATARTLVSFSRNRAWRDRTMASLGEWLGQLERPVGMLVARPGLARALADVALARGLRIPEDIGIIAGDDEPSVCELPPALTALRFDYAEVGRQAAALLESLMAGEWRPTRARAPLVPPTLIARRSTDRLAATDPVVANALWFIDAHRNEPIRVADVAAGLRVPLRELQGRFRRSGRDTVQHEITLARVEHAKLLLADACRGRRPAAPGRVQVTFDGPPPIPGGQGWTQWAEDPRRRAALVERLPDGTERIRRQPLPMPTTPPRPPSRAVVAEIARLSGFGSVDALERAFKRFVGMSPRTWSSRQP